MKQMNKACNYLMDNNITTPEKLEALLAKKEESLIGKDKDIEDLKQKVTDYRELITALEKYEKYKPVLISHKRYILRVRRNNSIRSIERD